MTRTRYVPLVLITFSIGALLILPLFVESTYLLHMMILVFISVIAGSSWNILAGFADDLT